MAVSTADNLAQRLHEAIAAACPILGVSIGTRGQNATVRIDYAPEATTEQKTAAAAALAAFDWEEAAHAAWQLLRDRAEAKALALNKKEMRALVLVAIDEINLLRSNAGLSQRTINQFFNAWNNKIDTLS